MKKYLIFDLDGTLTDPKVGITTCVQYALKSLGIEEPDLDKLCPFIGPPLKESFMEFYNCTSEQADQAVEKYRERFDGTGIYENKVYEGIPEMLKALRAKGIRLAVASSKPTVYVKRILDHFRIMQYFDVVVGSELDGTRTQKEEVVQEAIRRLFGDKPVDHQQIYMIGDRRFDIAGAKAMRVESVGVSYGYGSMEELKSARADYIVKSVEELQKFLLRGAEEVQAPRTTFQRLWQLLFPFLMFVLVKQIAMNILSIALVNIGNVFTGAIGDFLVIRDEAGKLIGFTGNAGVIMSALAFVAGAFSVWKVSKGMITRTAEEMKLTHLKKDPVKSYVLLFASVIGCVLGINLLFELTGLFDKSATYQAVAQDQYSAAFIVGIICFGFVTPVAEELLFRGILFNGMKRFMKLPMAVLLSSFLFGAYHLNPIQGMYGFLIGCLMAFGYEYFGSFGIPVAVHVMANLLAYVLTYSAIVTTGFVSWPVCIALLVLGGGSVWLLMKEKKIF